MCVILGNSLDNLLDICLAAWLFKTSILPPAKGIVSSMVLNHSGNEGACKAISAVFLSGSRHFCSLCAEVVAGMQGAPSLTSSESNDVNAIVYFCEALRNMTNCSHP